MSFDVYFLSRRPGETWEDAMATLEEAAEREDPFTGEHEALWATVEERVRTVLPDLELFAGDRNRELTHVETGMQLTMFPGEISLSIPYWYEGPEAERITATLSDVARAVEETTGLVAFDPQADKPFLEGGDETAAATLSEVREWVRERGLETGQTIPEQPKGPSLLRRLWLGRR